MAHGTWHMAHGTWHTAHGTWHTAHVPHNMNVIVPSGQYYSCTEHQRLPVKTVKSVNDVTVYCAVRQLLTQCIWSPKAAYLDYCQGKL